MRKKRILFFTNLYPSSQERERGVFVSQLVEEMASFVDVKVVCPLPWFPKSKLLQRFNNWSKLAQVAHEGEINGIMVYYPRYLLIPKISEILHALLMFLGTFRLLNKIRTQFKPDVLITMWLYPDAVSAVCWAKLNKIPVIVGGRGCDINRDLCRRFIKPQILYALSNAQHITTVSEALKNKLLGYGVSSKKMDVIANGVNHKLFSISSKSSCRGRLDLCLDKKIILVVAQLVPVKDHKTLLSALSLLREDADLFNSLSVYLVGEGNLDSELKQMAADLKVNHIVKFIGQQQHDLIPIWMGASDLLCLPSIREGRPNVIIESLACGLPIVASAVGGIPELVNQHNGLLFPAGDAEELSGAIRKCLARNWDKNLVAKTCSHLTWNLASRKYLQLIEMITGKKAN